MPDAAFGVCLRFVFRFPYGLYGMGVFLAAIVLLVVAIMHMGAGNDGQYDKTRNLTYSHKGTYGTAGFLNPRHGKARWSSVIRNRNYTKKPARICAIRAIPCACSTWSRLRRQIRGTACPRSTDRS